MTASTPTRIRIGTRGSRLALWQANHVADRLRARGFEPELVPIETSGDRDKVRDFGSLGAKGIFVKELETALIERRIDIAVHSLKDLPTDLPSGLVLGAVLEREEPWDVLVTRDGRGLDSLATGATVATGSLRRACQILAIRPDLQTAPLRGNVPTRIRKIREGEAGADATLLALAGLRRLEMEDAAAEIFDPQRVTPAMGQGALAIESRADEFDEMLRELEHRPSRVAADAERRFVGTLGGGCRTPVGVLAELDADGTWRFIAALGSADGRHLLRETRERLSESELDAAARELAAEFLDRADEAILATLDRPRAAEG